MDVATTAMEANRPSAARDAQRRYTLHLMRANAVLRSWTDGADRRTNRLMCNVRRHRVVLSTMKALVMG